LLVEEIEKSKKTGISVLLWDYLIPTVSTILLAFICGRYLSAPILRYFMETPYLGEFIFNLPFRKLYQSYDFWNALFGIVIFLVWSWISLKNIRIAGPGRPIRLWYAALAKNEIKEDAYVDPFPPDFDHKDPDLREAIKEVLKKDPLARIIGFSKRFADDIEEDKRKGLKTESKNFYEIFYFDEKSRYRHIQVVGGSGSGKSNDSS